MATRRRKPGSKGRATPKSGPPPPPRGPRPPVEPVQIGRRPSSPSFLVVVAVMWIGVGVIIQLTMSWSWRLVPAIVAVGIGLMFFRGAVRTVIRRDDRQSGDAGR